METIASVENLGDLASSVDSCCQGAADCVAETSVELERLTDAADANLSSATQALEEARGEVARLQQRIDSLQQSLDSADEQSRDGISNNLSAAEADLDQANGVLAQREKRHEKAADAARKAGELRERFLQASRTSMNRLAGLEQDCVSRLNRACEALERYAAEHPTSTTAMFHNWVGWKPGKSDLVSPRTLADRLHLSPPLLQKMTEYEAVRIAVMLTSIGTGIEEALGSVGIQIGKAGCKALICKVPKKLIGKINKFFGVKLLSKFSKHDIVQLGKAVPFAGGIVGGTVNVFGCRTIGRLALMAFPVEGAA